MLEQLPALQQLLFRLVGYQPEGGACRNYLVQYALAMLLLAYAGPSSNVRVERSSRKCFNDGGAIGEVMSLYEKLEEDTLILGHGRQPAIRGEGNHHLGVEDAIAMPELIVQALALTIHHLKVFGLERIICLGALLRPFSSTYEMKLSTNTLHQLEVPGGGAGPRPGPIGDLFSEGSLNPYTDDPYAFD